MGKAEEVGLTSKSKGKLKKRDCSPATGTETMVHDINVGMSTA